MSRTWQVSFQNVFRTWKKLIHSPLFFIRSRAQFKIKETWDYPFYSNGTKRFANESPISCKASIHFMRERVFHFEIKVWLENCTFEYRKKQNESDFMIAATIFFLESNVQFCSHVFYYEEYLNLDWIYVSFANTIFVYSSHLTTEKNNINIFFKYCSLNHELLSFTANTFRKKCRLIRIIV